VKGFTPDIVKLISPYLSVNDTVQLNINTARAEVLMSLDLAIDRDVAQAIIDYRDTEPIKKISQLEDVLTPQIYAVLKTLANLEQLGTTSRGYRIESTGLVNDGTRHLIANVDKKGNKLLFLKVN